MPTIPFRFARAFLLGCALVLAGFGGTNSAAAAAEIAILADGDTGPFADAVTGARNHLAEALPGVQIDAHVLPAAGESAASQLDDLRRDPPSLLLTLGSASATLAASEFPGIPRIAGLVTRTELLGAGGSSAGVTLDFPVAVELEWLKRFFPGKRSIGILFDPAINQEKIAAAKKAARKLGIELVPYEVGSPRALPEALKVFANRIDVLWGMSDPVVFSPATAKSILVFSYRNRIPLTGLSDAWTNAGALYSLDRDYADIGRQCAEIAVQTMQGKNTSTLPTKHPRKVVYSVNLKAARHMNLKISETLVENARYVVR